MSPPPERLAAAIRFGCCGNMISPSDPVGISIIEELGRLGFDYVELSLRDVTALAEPEFVQLAERVRRSGLVCEACNNFFPATIRLTGPDADPAAALAYAEKAFARAARLGVAIVVFGSSAARNVPDGFPLAQAWEQLRSLLAALGPLAQARGITVVIEHLHRGESNIVNTVADGWRLAQEVAHPQVRVLADTYHLLREAEAPAIIDRVGPALRHTHLAQGPDRRFPLAPDPALRSFFAALRNSGYAGRCSIEAYTDNFAPEAAAALAVVRTLAQSPG
jgi:D-psicose/D-tagatose/L-ribulose 3-epimerase